MALTVTAGAQASRVNSTPVAVAYPTPTGGILSTDYLVLEVTIKKATQAGTEAPATPTGWTALVNLEGGANVAAAADVGLCRVYTFVRQAAGGETGNLSVVINNIVTGNFGSNVGGRMWHIRSDTYSDYVSAGATGQDATGGTGWAALFSTNPGITSGDIVILTHAAPTDTIPTGIPAGLTATGVTFGAAADHATAGSALGLDGGSESHYRPVTAGTATGNATWSGTIGGTTTNWYGPAALVRVREGTTPLPQAPITVTPFETVWNTSTTSGTPKSINVTSCAADDLLLVIAGGAGGTPAPTAITTSTTTGTVGTISEQSEDLAASCWHHAATIPVTGSGDVNVQVTVTFSGTFFEWGFMVLKCRRTAGGALAVGTVAPLLTNNNTQVVSMAVSEDSAVGMAIWDFQAQAVGGVAVTPADGTFVENAAMTNVSLSAAYWNDQTAGTRNYGFTGYSVANIKGVAVEIDLSSGVVPASFPPEHLARRVMTTLLVGGH